VSADANLALFLLLGQTANKKSVSHPSVVDGRPLMISKNHDLASSLPESVRNANHAVDGYRLFFVFETYLKDFVIQTLSKDGKETWWDKVPKDVQDEITKLEDTEELKSWMALGSRDKSALMTYPQLLRVIDVCWKDFFQDLVRDKALVQEARLISHLRNTLCHMTCISDEETDRIKMVIRDWFRVISP
jgi:hypothetical protein